MSDSNNDNDNDNDNDKNKAEQLNELANQKTIAVLIDADNVQPDKMKAILKAISAYGRIVVKRAYGDWSSDQLKNWPTLCNELAINPITQFTYKKGKNSTDVSLVIGAMDLLHTKDYDIFALVSSDSDFTGLASRLREDKIFVLGVGEKKALESFINACDDFIFTEPLPHDENTSSNPPAESPAKSEKASNNPSLEDLKKIVTEFWDKNKDVQGWANVSPAYEFLKKEYPSFNFRNDGYTKIYDFFEKKLGFKIAKNSKHSKRILFKPSDTKTNATPAKSTPPTAKNVAPTPNSGDHIPSLDQIKDCLVLASKTKRDAEGWSKVAYAHDFLKKKYSKFDLNKYDVKPFYKLISTLGFEVVDKDNNGNYRFRPLPASASESEKEATA